MTSFDQQDFSSEDREDFWNEFLLEFPTESSCVEELFRRVFDRELSCLNCGSIFVKPFNNSRILYCCDCKVEFHTLAGTFFHNIRRPRAWAGAIWFMERGVPLNSCQFARLANIAESSAQKIFKDLSLLLVRNLQDNSVMNSCSFLPVFQRRSRVTPAGQDPQSEESSMQESNENGEDFEDPVDYVVNVAAANGIGLDNMQLDIIKLLAIQSCDEDEIVMRTGHDVGLVSGHCVAFQIYDMVDTRGGRFVLKLPQSQKNVEMNEPATQLRTRFIRFIAKVFGGISRKYLQNYLGWFWSVIDRRSWPAKSINAELLRHGRLSPEESRDYVSPRQVKCPLNFFSANINKTPLQICAQ